MCVHDFILYVYKLHVLCSNGRGTRVMDRFNKEEHRKYWEGLQNRLVRYYFYTQRGLALLNEFRYLLMGILAVYALLKMDSPIYMILMFIVSIPILIVLGWVYVYKMASCMDYLNTQFSTHFSKYSIKLQEDQLAEVKKIRKKIK